jgi:tRNA/rRNA methyltransferase
LAVAIVLVEPEIADNIGATARAMKNMGLKDLRLVNPRAGWREGQNPGRWRSAFLDEAKVFTSLKEAVSDAVLWLERPAGKGKTARLSGISGRDGETAHGGAGKTAGCFWAESKGLLNEELQVCDWFTTIPTSEDFPSINLAQAVMSCVFFLFTDVLKRMAMRRLNMFQRREFEK